MVILGIFSKGVISVKHLCLAIALGLCVGSTVEAGGLRNSGIITVNTFGEYGYFHTWTYANGNGKGTSTIEARLIGIKSGVVTIGVDLRPAKKSNVKQRQMQTYEVLQSSLSTSDRKYVQDEVARRKKLTEGKSDFEVKPPAKVEKKK